MAQYTQINPDALVTALTPINNSLGGKQDKTDSTLATTDKTISGAINEINTKVSNLTGALTWKGKFDTLPAVTDYEAGNVVGVGNKEYVLTVTGSTKAWEELGDEGSYLLKSVAEETYAKKTSIPTVNDPKVSIKMNGTEKGSFTLNQVAAGEVDLGTVITAHQDISGKVDKTLNAKSFEGITIRTTNSAEDKAANVAAIKAYVNNLKTLGVDTTKGYMIPIRTSDNITGVIYYDTDNSYKGVGRKQAYTYSIAISQDGKWSSSFLLDDGSDYSTLATYSKRIINAINEVNRHVHGVNAFGAIELKARISDLNKIKLDEYLDILATAGVSRSNGYSVPVRITGYSQEYHGILNIGTGALLSGVVTDVNGNHYYPFKVRTTDGVITFDESNYFLEKTSDEDMLETSRKDLVGAINEVNTLAKSKGNGTITEVRMNGASKGTSGVVDLGTVITAHQDISGKVDKTLNAKAFEGITIKTSNTTEARNANKAALKAYIDNLKALGVDIGKGINVPVKTDDNFYGCLVGEYFGEVGNLSGSVFSVSGGEYYIKDIYISSAGYYNELVNIKNDNDLNTTSKDLIGAINEVNTLAKSKGNGTITGVKMNGVSKGTSGVVDLGTVITAHQDISGKQDKLISGTNIKTINGESVLGSGDITISSGASSSAYPEVNHGTGDTTFTLTPNTFHVWDEVASLTLNFGNETSGVANEYLFQFTSGSTATSLTLPDSIKWANDNAPTIGANMIYQVSVLRGLASVLEFNNAIVFPIIGDTGGNANEEYAKVYEYFVSTYNLTSASPKPSSGVIITETLICNDTYYGGPVLKVSLSENYLLLWTQKAINRMFVPRINNLGVYSNYMWD